MTTSYVDPQYAASVATVEIRSLVRDAGTHGRAGIDPLLVGTYADLMKTVGILAPIVVFSDGQRTVLADGFHRVAAAEQIGRYEIQAEIRRGSASDALWYALGALRPSRHAARVTGDDLRHAVRRAYETWPDLSLAVVAEQIGVQSIFVAQAQDELRKTVKVPRDSVDVTTHPKYAQMREMLREGLKSREVAKALGVRDAVVAAVRRLVRGGEKRTATHRQQAHSQIRVLAGRGYGSRQIAKSVGLSEERVRLIAKSEGFEIAADKTIGKSKRLDSNRIMEKIAMSADTLVDGSELVEYGALDRVEIAAWLVSLTDCREKLGSLIRRLQKEQT